MAHLTDLFSPDDLRAARDAGLVNLRESGTGLRILNYSDTAVYTPGSWDNPAVRQCRGLIVNGTDHVVARPWAKFFNHGQDEAGTLDLTAPVEVTDKMDGSLGVVFRHPDGTVAVATRGSFSSDQAIHATAVLQARPYVSDTDVLHRFTPLTEIVYPDNRIVCDYGDTDDLFLLGGVWIDDGRYVGPAEAAEITGWTGPQAPTFAYPTFADALAAPPRPGAEGLCVRYRDQPRIVKIKQEDYVALHKIVTGLSERTVWETLSADADGLNGLLGGLPDELHAWTREVWQRLVADLDALTGDVIASRDAITATLTRGFGRKEFALEAVRHRHRPYLFLALDEQYDRMRSVILADLKPAGDTRPRSRGEDVA